MSPSLPSSVRETWGERAAEDFSDWIEEYVQHHAVPRDEYREVRSHLGVIEERLDQMDGRFDRIENRFDQFDQRLDEQSAQINQRLDEQSAQFNQRLDEQSAQIHQRLDEQNAQFNQRIDAVNERLDRLHEQMRVMMRWTVGTIALFGTIVTVLLATAEFAA